MAFQNIGIGNRDDVFYRYKMPRLITKIEGRGNGMKTNLVNIVDVAKALARPPAYITKFYGCELGAQSKFDEKTNTAIVNGAHETTKLSALLDTFIKKYVQCYGCGNPETGVIVTKGQCISLKCAACGFSSQVDMRDKLTTFILKNPAVKKTKKGLRKAANERIQAGEVVAKQGMKELKKGYKDVKKVGKKKGPSSDEDKSSAKGSVSDDADSSHGEDMVEWQSDTSAQAAQQRVEEQLNEVTSEMVMLSFNKENMDVHNRTFNHDSSDSSCLYEKLLKTFKLALDEGCSPDQFAVQLHALCPRISQEAMDAFFDALFDGVQKGLANEIGRKRVYLRKSITDKYRQVLLLGSIESHYSSRPPEICKEIAISLKMLYDLDILDENVIIAWYRKGLQNRIKVLAKPFVDWVQNAESEED
ncbi:hypothetical protein KP509_07G041500 [Ceratopteris richardii]|uniref:W2 domain-containing protein n=1 Tax=Ceratopteris richardii TaxID=49495 RepID=A0A8T2UE75_CERRI|nr:hypothetical protein KP509_07G041500 [Ceratopteris richardii]KAH7432811.1 hypothetical protein KP509_07G041500 [Ceratopteris richardii]